MAKVGIRRGEESEAGKGNGILISDRVIVVKQSATPYSNLLTTWMPNSELPTTSGVYREAFIPIFNRMILILHRRKFILTQILFSYYLHKFL